MSWGKFSSLVMLMAGLITSAEASEYQARALIKAVDRAVLSAELAAKVTALPLRPGDPFTSGDLLVGLDCSLYQAQKLKVAAEQQAAIIKLENVKKLNQLRSVGAMEVALAQSHLDQMEAALHIAQLNTERCSIRAPYDGKVINHLINRFETIQAHQELIEIIDSQQLKAEIIAPADWLSWLTPDVPVRLYIDQSNIVVEGSLSAITPAIDSISQTIVLHVKLSSNPKLIPGMSATAELLYPEK